ncbi:serine hydrolase domain-containing protein [Streptomyces yaizuensis]|uniref:Serine hydrolase n=1 Tax=Streptomyces yaizuensis TaxID=2989713 RepID=A0ABQ5P575_9ACTN|nr:serine hydrolase domain-containing protein [Streptomyces sp. YSPA8]GLF97737.1 serine hydrolase [Streptomyces sp. YSPA8]
MVVRAGVVGLVAAALTVTAFTVPARSGDQTRGGPAERNATQQAIEELVRDGVPGVVARSTAPDGVWKGVAGVADRRTGAPRKANERFRIGSITKTFAATVLLKLEAEGRLSLDDTVEKHLPGLIREGGNDGRTITVRQLLNHSSGLPEYLRNEAFNSRYLQAPGFFGHRYDRHDPEDLIRAGLALGRDFAPGARHQYSNTGYIVAGLIIEKVTGTSYRQAVRDRVTEPLGLRNTASPGTSVRVPRPSARGYDDLGHPGKGYDTTELSPTIAWSAGDMISTTADLNRFFSALLGGEVLPVKQLKAMKTTLPAADGTEYGLGIYTATTSCGTKLWGHAGGIVGWGTDAMTTEDGRHTLAFSLNGLDALRDGLAAVRNAEFCGNAVSAVRRGSQ